MPTVGTACRFSVELTLHSVGLKVGLVDTWTPYDVAPVTRSHDSTGIVPSVLPLGASPGRRRHHRVGGGDADGLRGDHEGRADK